MDMAAWLRGLGLGQYEAAFRENAVDASVLPELTAEDLREMGIAAIGHRRKLLAAAAALRAPPASDPAAVPASSRAATDHRPMLLPGPEGDALSAERRQVTVLFCDLAGSTALSGQLDPEDLREVMAAYHGAVTRAVQDQGGYVAKFLGDGVLAYFGWPTAHEDDAERAVQAGLAAVQAVAGLRSPAGPLEARVGIATGPVVVGDILGEGAARERGVVGETPNLAASLQALAAPGAVVVDDVTHRLTGAMFAWADLGAATLKGVSRPVRARQALGESGIESRFEALRGGHPAPLVGREEELELLLRRWHRARAGEGQVVLLRGEAGIGKSRLTAALQQALADEVHEAFVLFGSPQHTDSALHPIIDRLERAAGLSPGDAPEARLAKLEALLTPLALPPGDVTLIAELLAMPTLGRWPTLELSPQRRRERLLQALLRRVQALAGRRPTLAVVEDAHWADPTTREFLDLLVTAVPSMPLLLVVTQRPEFDPGAWIGLPHVTPLQLNRLAPAEHAALLRQVAGKALPAEVEAEILSHTDGVPLFVEEVTRAVLEAGLLREEADRWVLDGSLPPVAVPASLQASLVARLDRLSSVREVTQAGAVLGRAFAHDLLAAVSGLSEAALSDALGQLVGADLVQRRGAPPDATYTFRHALIQDAAHANLLRERRRDLHARAAAAIERLRPEVLEREPEVLAHHNAEAGAAEAATALYLRAGQRSAARSAFREARAHLARGLALLPQVPGEKTARRLEARLQIALGNVEYARGGMGSAEVKHAFERAVELCRELDEGSLLIQALWGLWAVRLPVGDFLEALHVTEEAVAVARQHGSGEQMSRALSTLGAMQWSLGWNELARSSLEEALAIEGAFEVSTGAVSGGAMAGPMLGRALACMGLLERSVAVTLEAIERTRRAGHLLSLANALSVSCTQVYFVRDIGLLRGRVHALIDLADEQGFPFYRARVQAYAGWVAVNEGRVAEGIGLISESIISHRKAGVALQMPHFEAMLAEGYLVDGNADVALAHIEEALRISVRTGEVCFDPELHRCLGRLRLRLNAGDTARAEHAFQRALESARSQSARLFELRAASDLARLWRDHGRLAEARELLASVYAAFTEGFAFPDLVEVRALLEEFGQSAASAQPVRSSESDITALPR
jgi:class 3 adenylate cyclase/tetratricopeptide (TPR) repeat protein